MTKEQGYVALKALVPSLAKAQRDFLSCSGLWPTLAEMLDEPPFCEAYLRAAVLTHGWDTVDRLLRQIES